MRTWRASSPRRGARRAGIRGPRSRQSFSSDAYVPDRIAALDLSLPGDIAQVVMEAELALRQLDARAVELPALEALARQLLRAESVASSRIEGLVLSHRRLAKAAYSQELEDVTARSVLANIRAMDAAIAAASSGPLQVSTLLGVHRVLFEAFGDPEAGRVRTEQNWIGGAASSPRDAEFVPPPPSEVPALLDDLLEFARRDDVPPVVQAAVAHAQFETIHPFADGNGRVGRCFIHVVLRRRGVVRRVVPPVSLVLATNARAYVGGLTDFRAERVLAWCGLFAAAVRTAAEEAERFAVDLRQREARWLAQLGPARADAAARRLLPLLPVAPVLDVGTAERLLGVSNQAARLAMAQLESAGLLVRVNAGRRHRAWEAPDVFELLNAFERRLATRRGGRTRLRPAPG